MPKEIKIVIEDAWDDDFQKHILAQLTDEQWTAGLEAALKWVLDNRGNSKRPLGGLQDSFDMAVQDVARQIVAEHLATDPELRRKLKQMLDTAIRDMMGNNRDMQRIMAERVLASLADSQINK